VSRFWTLSPSRASLLAAALAERRRVEIGALNDAADSMHNALADRAGRGLGFELRRHRAQEVGPQALLDRRRQLGEHGHLAVVQLDGWHGRA
jgi:hypothetical protein